MKLKNNENNKENMKKKLNNAPYKCSTKNMHLWIQIVSHVVFCLITNMFIPNSTACGTKTCLKLVSMPGPLAELFPTFKHLMTAG